MDACGKVHLDAIRALLLGIYYCYLCIFKIHFNYWILGVYTYLFD